MRIIQKYYNYFMEIVLLYVIVNFGKIHSTELFLLLFGMVMCYLIPKYIVKNSLTIYIVSVVLLVIMVYQPIDSIIHTDLYSNSIRTSGKRILNKQLRETYIGYCIIYYMVFSFADFVYRIYNAHVKVKTKRIQRTRRLLINQNVYVVATIWSFIRYYIQMQFHILYAGQAATISHAGIIVYLIRIITLFVWASAIQQINKASQNVGVFVWKALVLAIICGAPQAYIGTRSEILIYLIQILIIVFLHYTNGKVSLGKVFGVVLLIIVMSAISIYIVYYFRTGVTRNVLSFLTERMVGLIDGINVINYVQSGGDYLPVTNFFKAIISADNTMYISVFYTHYICGYPMEILHSWSIPGFCAGLLYGNATGMVIFTLVQGFVCSYVENKIKSCLSSNMDDVFKACCYLYLYVELFFACIFEGSIDRLSNFVIIAAIALIVHNFIGISMSSKNKRAKPEIVNV